MDTSYEMRIEARAMYVTVSSSRHPSILSDNGKKTPIDQLQVTACNSTGKKHVPTYSKLEKKVGPFLAFKGNTFDTQPWQSISDWQSIRVVNKEDRDISGKIKDSIHNLIDQPALCISFHLTQCLQLGPMMSQELTSLMKPG